jgi:hypothetical protein
MRTISRCGRFKRDYKRLKAGPLGAKFDDLLREALALLAADLPRNPPGVAARLSHQISDVEDGDKRWRAHFAPCGDSAAKP